jgi:hypothetical protein
MENIMRKILLASAALVLSAGSAMAVTDDDATVAIEASLAQDCDITIAETALSIGPTTGDADTSDVTTSCNYVGAHAVSFSSLNGGVKNLAGDIVDYKVTFDALTHTTGDAGEFGSDPTVTQGTKVLSVALAADLIVAGDYTDTLTITVTP